MTSDVEIPDDRIYRTKMLINSDISGGVVLDFVDPKTFDTRVMVYVSNDDMIELLQWIEVNADSLKDKRNKKVEFAGREQDDK
jgi:hypothetical protein